MTVLTLDPGESTGWLFTEVEDRTFRIVSGGTLKKDHQEVYNLIKDCNPSIILYETFRMYPGKAKALSWNSFYPCEVIGVIKYAADSLHKTLVGLAPSTKKYAGGFNNPQWISFRQSHDYTEHTKDTWLLFRYWFRNKYLK